MESLSGDRPTHTRRYALNRFMDTLGRFPRFARVMVGASSLLALVVASGAGYKWG